MLKLLFCPFTKFVVPEDNHVIADLVSILLTRVLGDDRFHLLRRIKRPKGKAYVETWV